MIIKIQPVEDVKPADLQPHPLADLFPMMEDEAFDDFARDIETNGQREPIILHENKILDGRNRFKACQRLGISPRFREYNGGDPLGFVISLNLMRRHLTESQRAMVADSLANLRDGQRKQTVKSANLPITEAAQIYAPVSQTEAAKMLNVSRRSVQTARKVREDGAPELVKAVESGAVSVSAAAVIAKQPIEVQQHLMSPSQEKELSTAIKRLQDAKAMKEEADRFVPPAPLTTDERAEQERIFGTRETRGFLEKVLTTGELIPTLPLPTELANSVPAAMENIITDNINAMREVSKWFDAFVSAWQAKEER